MPQRVPKGGRSGVGLGLRRGPSSFRRLFSKAASRQSEPPSQGFDAGASPSSPAPVQAPFEGVKEGDLARKL